MTIDLLEQNELEKILSRATDILVRKYGAILVVFHGSRLFGDPYPDSDIDLLVVKETGNNPVERAKEAEALLQQIGSPVAFDVQVWTPEEVRVGLSEGQTYVGVALFNGKILYGKEKDLMAPARRFYNVSAWLKDARLHLKFAKSALDDGEEIGAMDQLFQSVERYLKAYLMTKDTRVEMVHSLPGLLEQAISNEPAWKTLKNTMEIAYEWGRACHYPPRHEGEVRIVPTLSEVRELYEKLEPWIRTIDKSLEVHILKREKDQNRKGPEL